MDPTTSLINNTDILVEIGPGPLIKEMGLTMDSRWSPPSSWTRWMKTSGIFSGPIWLPSNTRAARSATWAIGPGPTQVTKDDLEVISYPLPLLDRDGQVYGVVGVEITLEYLANQMSLPGALGQPERGPSPGAAGGAGQ